MPDKVEEFQKAMRASLRNPVREAQDSPAVEKRAATGEPRERSRVRAGVVALVQRVIVANGDLFDGTDVVPISFLKAGAAGLKAKDIDPEFSSFINFVLEKLQEFRGGGPVTIPPASGGSKSAFDGLGVRKEDLPGLEGIRKALLNPVESIAGARRR